MSKPDRHTVAIVGAGIGRQHLEGYMALPDRFWVSTVCDLDEERAGALAARAGNCGTATDFETILVDPQVDLVDICLPPHLHFDAATRALKAGKHVICEKPLAASLYEADRLIETAAQAGRVLAPVLQYRYGRGFRQLLGLVERGVAGRPFVATLETHWDRDPDYYSVPWRGTWAGELGGAVLCHAIHIHDLLSTALGPVRRVTALTTTRVNDIEVEDCAAIAFELASGALATSSITLGSADNMSRLRFCFENLTAESGLDPYHPASGHWTFKARPPARQMDIDAALENVPHAPEGFAGFFAALDKRIRNEDSDAIAPADARQSLELASAIYQSARTGQAVTLPLTPDDPVYQGWAQNGPRARSA